MALESRVGATPEAICRSSAISACEGTWKAATVLLRDFPVFTIEVDVIAFNSVPRAKKDTLTFHVMIV